MTSPPLIRAGRMGLLSLEGGGAESQPLIDSRPLSWSAPGLAARYDFQAFLNSSSQAL